MPKSEPHLFLIILALTIWTWQLASAFQFKPIQTTFSPTTIREVATYDFSLNRQMTKDLAPTNWQNEPIPPNSIIKIIFPSQYSPSDLTTFSCNSVMLDFNLVDSFSCTLDSPTLEITISGLFPTISNFSFIDIQLTNIRNPSPSIMTDPFVVHVGNDHSANDTRASVFFDPAQLDSVNITFSNPTVNTTSDMIISVQVKNYFPAGGHIELMFPPTLVWSRDISSNHLFPIDGILTCEGVSSNVNNVITCLGQRSTRVVAFANIVSNDIPAGTVITFKLKNMFSPPTTQTTNPSDSLQMKTFDGSSNQIQFKQAFVSGLKPKVFTNLQILPLFGQASFIVNRNSGLNFTFTLEDTVNFEDYFHMIFPASTFISYTNPSTIFRLTPSSNYNSTNSTLTLFQSSTNNPERAAGSSAFIGFVTYRVPKSGRVQNISLKVMKYGFEKIVGWSTVRAQANQYLMISVGLNETKVNAKTVMRIDFELKDALMGSGMMMVQVPERTYVNEGQLSVECNSSAASGTRIKQFPAMRYFRREAVMGSTSGSSSQVCGSAGGCLVIGPILDNVGIELPVQNVTLSISGLRNNEFVADIGTVMVRTFYDSEWDSRVAQISQSNTTVLRTTSGSLTLNAISFDQSAVNFQSTTLSLTLLNENPIPVTGNILINIPSDLFVQLTLSPDSKLPISLFINTLKFLSTEMLPISVTAGKFVLQIDLSKINFADATSIANQSSIVVVFDKITAAPSSEPFTANDWYAKSFTPSMNLIDELKFINPSNLIYRTIIQNPLMNSGVIRSLRTSSNITVFPLEDSFNDCLKNAQTCGSYIFAITQEQPFQVYTSNSSNLNAIEVEIPGSFDLSSVQNVYLSIESQLVFADNQNIKVYKPAVSDSVQWIQCQFKVPSTTNNTKILSITLPYTTNLDTLSSFLTQSTFNRLQLPSTITKSTLKSSFYLLAQNIRNPFSLFPFTIAFRTLKSVQNLNNYIYSSAVSDIYKNTELMDLSISSFDFSNKYFSQQSTLTIKVSIANWNEVSPAVEMRNKMRNNVKYIILAMGNGFSFNNVSSLGTCFVDVLSVRESVSCTIEEISADFSWTKKINSTGNANIVNALSSSKYLVVFTLSDTLSVSIQSATQTEVLTLSFGPVINPSVAEESLSTALKSVSVFTLTQLEYLIHKSILQIVFATNCLSPCKECLFTTNISSQVSSKCKSCFTGSLFYNNTCLITCPDKTFQSSVKDSDNITSIGICLDCPSQCASCSDNTSCTDCNSSSAFKYQIYNSTTNITDCLSSCPINGFYENAVTGNETQNVTEYECATCKTNCSVCSGATDCFKCTGFLVLSKNLCIDACPSGTVQSVQNILFKNTTVSNVRVCVECSVHLNDSNCVYCNSSECLACSTNFTLDYLASKKCLSQCTEGFYNVGDKVLGSENYTYAVCEKCANECKTCKDVAPNCLTCKWVDSVVTGQYYQLGNTCYLAGACPGRYFADQASKTCSNCSLVIAGCLTCSSNKFCSDCNQTAGYFNFTSVNSQNITTSLCLQSTEIPRGYLLINGQIKKCGQHCTQCSIGVSNCTDCVNGYYLFNLATGIGTCVNQCPQKYYPANAKLCTPCPNPCELCQVNAANVTRVQCLSCRVNSSLYVYQNECIQASQCPDVTYPYTNPVTNQKSCKACLNNCNQCQDDGTTCLDCAPNFYFHNKTCIAKESCPIGTVGIIANQFTGQGLCAPCFSTCKTCNINPNTCTSCITGLYYNREQNSCVPTCPPPLINDLSTMTCVQCTAPCNTCQGSTTNCTSCIQTFYKLQSDCVLQSQCSLGYFADPSTRNCEPCPLSCSNCYYSDNKVVCYQCKDPSVLYQGACTNQCPQSKAYNVSGVCMNCTEAIVGCLVCTYTPQSVMNAHDNEIYNSDILTSKQSSAGTLTLPFTVSTSTDSQLGCSLCSFPYIFLNDSCTAICPSGYLYKQQTNECITVEQKADAILSQSLTTPTIMPLPFTMISCILIVACVLSKLQNQNTYFVGIVYSFLGIAETVSVAYFLLKVTAQDTFRDVLKQFFDPTFLLFLIVLGWIYATNVLAVLFQTYVLSSDPKFIKYQKSHCFTFIIVSILSTLTSYKFKLVIATRLFNFSCFKSQLESIQKFNIFNIFSFIGIGHEGLLLYVIGLTLARFKSQLGEEMFLAMVDVGIIAIINLVLALAVSKKEEDFFYEKHEGIILRKTFDGGEDSETIEYQKEADTSKTSLNHEQTPGKTGIKYGGHDSNQNIMPDISQDDEFSLSISRDEEEDRQQNIFDDRGHKRNMKDRNSSEDEDAMKSSSQLKNIKLDNMKDMAGQDELTKLNNKSMDLSRSRHTLEHLKNLGNINKSSIIQNPPKQAYNMQPETNKIKSGLVYSLNDKYKMEDINQGAKGQRSQEKLNINDAQNLNGEDFINQDNDEHDQNYHQKPNPNPFEQNYSKVKSQLDNLDETEEKELPQNYEGAVNQGWEIEEPTFNEDQNIMIFEETQNENDVIQLDEHNQKHDQHKQITNSSVIKVKSHLEFTQPKQNQDLFGQFNQQPFNNNQLNQSKHNNNNLSVSNNSKLPSGNLSFIKQNQPQTSAHISNEKESLQTSNLPNDNKSGLNQSSDKANEKKESPLESSQFPIPSSIKSNHKANNFFNEPLEEQTQIKNSFFDDTNNKNSLLEQKEKELAVLRKSRQDLENQTTKLKKRSRSRSKSINKGDSRSKSIKKGDQYGSKPENRYSQSVKNSNANAANESSLKNDESSIQALSSKQDAKNRAGTGTNFKGETQRMTAQEILKLGSLASKQKYQHEQSSANKNCEAVQNLENQIILFQEEDQETNNNYQKSNSNQAQQNQTHSQTQTHFNHQQQSNIEKDNINQLLTSRMQSKSSKNKLPSHETYPQIQPSQTQQPHNYHMNLNLITAKIQDAVIQRTSRSRQPIHVSSTQRQDYSSVSNKIDLGQFADQLNSNHDQIQYRRIYPNSNQHFTQNYQNHQLLSKPNPISTQNTHSSKTRDIASLDSISPSKMRPPTSKPNNQFQKGDLPPHDSSFLTGKPAKSFYPLQYRNKQIGSEKDDSQVEVSFYHMEDNTILGENSFQDYQKRYGSNDISSHSSRLKEQGGYGNTEPTKPITMKNQRLEQKGIYQNDELSRLISKNVNKKVQSSRVQRQSIDKSTIPRGPSLRTQRRSQERIESAKSRNKSIQKNEMTLKEASEYDALDDYYNRGRRAEERDSAKNQDMKRSRSKSRERPMSKQSENKLKALQKIYLQKLEWKK